MVWPQQKAGAPGSPGYRWVEEILLTHGPHLIADGLLSEEQWESFMQMWESYRIDPATMLFSPMVVATLARRV